MVQLQLRSKIIVEANAQGAGMAKDAVIVLEKGAVVKIAVRAIMTSAAIREHKIISAVVMPTGLVLEIVAPKTPSVAAMTVLEINNVSVIQPLRVNVKLLLVSNSNNVMLV